MSLKIAAALLSVGLSMTSVAGMGAPFHVTAENASLLESDVCPGVVCPAGCSVEVEKQRIVIEVSDLSAPASVRTEYTFHNGAPEDTDFKLYIPVPAGECTVSVEGEEVDCVTRYAFQGTSKFDAIGEVAKIGSGRREDGFFRPDTPVTTSTFLFKPDGACKNSDYLHLFYEYDPDETLLIFSDDATVKTTNGSVHACWPIPYTAGGKIKQNRRFYVYAVGTPVSPVRCFVTPDAAGEAEDALCTLSQDGESDETDFDFFVGNLRPNKFGADDWYNGVVDMLNAKRKNGYSTVLRNAMTEEWFRPWYEYTVRVPAQSSVVNAVEAEVDPRVSRSSGKEVYSYEYLLSSAACWSRYGRLEIELLTSFSLFDSSLDFEKTKDGYELGRDGLPRGELTFSLAEKTEKAWGVPSAQLSPSTVVSLALLGVLAAGGVAAGIVYAVLRRRKK